MENNHSCSAATDNLCCFEELTDNEIQLLEQNKLEVTYKKGENICKQGAFASHIIYLCKGLAKVYIENGTNYLTLKVVPQGGFIGLTSLFSENNIFQNSAMAYQDSVVRMFDMKLFRKLINENAAFASQIINILCENSVQTYNRFFSLQHKQSYGRMADILLCLSDRIFKTSEFDLNISRQELADLTGLSKEQTIRTLKSFKDDNFIEMEGKTLKITDKNSLLDISNYG